MTSKPVGERLVAVETKMDSVLENQDKFAENLEKLAENLNKLLPTYATKKELAASTSATEVKLEELKRRHALQQWLVGTLSLALGILLTNLIEFYIKH